MEIQMLAPSTDWNGRKGKNCRMTICIKGGKIWMIDPFNYHSISLNLLSESGISTTKLYTKMLQEEEVQICSVIDKWDSKQENKERSSPSQLPYYRDKLSTINT